MGESDRSEPSRSEKSEAEWREALSPEEFRVMRKKGTEHPFTGEYVAEKRPGVYECKACGTPLFHSATKYDSGSGWPSFWKPLAEANVRTEEDTSHGMRRTEVLCASCGAHLGHLFPDGPDPTGLRYCINSVCLRLDPEEG